MDHVSTRVTVNCPSSPPFLSSFHTIRVSRLTMLYYRNDPNCRQCLIDLGLFFCPLCFHVSPAVTALEQAVTQQLAAMSSNITKKIQEEYCPSVPATLAGANRVLKPVGSGLPQSATVCNGIGSHVHARDDMSLLHGIDLHVHNNEV